MASAMRRYPKTTGLRPVAAPDIELTDDEESEDEETRLQREEEEQELELSRLHGEAAEGRGEKRKKTAEEIEAEYEKKVKNSKRQKRPTLTVDMITGLSGIGRIPIEFKEISYRGESKSISASAAYSLRLVESYKKFCFELMPSMAFEDVLLKIEKEGGTRQVKDYLQTMRNAQRDQYLQSLYGKEKAEQLLADLRGLLAEQGIIEEPVAAATTILSTSPEFAITGEQRAASIVSPPGITADPSHKVPTPVGGEVDEEEREFNFDQEEDGSRAEDAADSSSYKNLSNARVEQEASLSTQINKRRRLVLEDSSDDDEDEDDKVAVAHGPGHQKDIKEFNEEAGDSELAGRVEILEDTIVDVGNGPVDAHPDPTKFNGTVEDASGTNDDEDEDDKMAGAHCLGQLEDVKEFTREEEKIDDAELADRGGTLEDCVDVGNDPRDAHLDPKKLDEAGKDSSAIDAKDPALCNTGPSNDHLD